MSLRSQTILDIDRIEIDFLSPLWWLSFPLSWLSLDAPRTTNQDPLRGRAHSRAQLLGIAIQIWNLPAIHPVRHSWPDVIP